MSSSASWSKIEKEGDGEAQTNPSQNNEEQGGQSSSLNTESFVILPPYPEQSPATPRGIKGRTIVVHHGRDQTSEVSLGSSSLDGIPGRQQEGSQPSIVDDDGGSSTDNKFTESTTGIEQQYIDRLPLDKLQEEEEEETDEHLPQQGDIKARIKVFEGSLPEKFKLSQVLGNGHNGFVFAATEQLAEGQERKVAVKFLSSQRKNHVNRKLREVVAHGFIPPHPHIVHLLSPALSSGSYEYFVMELCDLSLDTWIDQTSVLRQKENASTIDNVSDGMKPKPALTAFDTIRLLFELADAIHALRLLGITHRDIKPSNILLKKNSELESSSNFPFSIKLSDFGVADLQVAETPSTLYDVNVSANLEGKTSRDEFTSEDDFRAAAASIFFAWLAEPRWKDLKFRESLLRDNKEFLKTTAVFDSPLDMQIIDLFEHILPTPRYFKAQDVYTLDSAVDKLTELGRMWGAGLFRLSGMDFDKVTQGFDGDLNDAKLDVYVGTALDIVSGRRRDKSRQMAQRFLDRAAFLIDRFNGTPPPYRSCELHFQRSLTQYLPDAQAAVRQFAAVIQSDGNNAENENFTSSRQKAETALETLNAEINKGFNFLPDDETGWKGVRRVQFHNLKDGLRCLEEVKFYSSLKDFDRAQRCADEGIGTLKIALKNQVELETPESSQEIKDDDHFNPLYRNKLRTVEPKYQLTRNIYLLMHEKQKIVAALGMEGDDDDFNRLAKDAMNLCERGMDFAMNSLNTSRADKLEMRRCYAEALFVAGENQAARDECKKVFDEFSKDLPSRAVVLRVLAIWIAALRRLVSIENDGSCLMELGFVCSLLIQRHEDVAKTLVGKNVYFVPNAKAFLAVDRESALLSGADPLLPMPILPEDPYILAQATRARRYIEQLERGVLESKAQKVSVEKK